MTAYPITTMPDMTAQGVTAYKTSIDTVLMNFKRKSGGMSVEAQATPNMTVKVQPGSYFKNSQSTLIEYAGGNATISAAPSSPNSRIDRIVYNTTTDAVDVVAGTPGTSPTAPSIPSQCIPLARVLVESGVTVIPNGKITDERPAFWQGGGDFVIIRNVYTSNSTWYKDSKFLYGFAQVISGGGGGCRTGATTTSRLAPAPGIYNEGWLDAATLGSSESITVGSAGAGRITTTGNGNAGGTSSFGSHITCTGGTGGQTNNATVVSEGTATGGSLARAGKSYGTAIARAFQGTTAYLPFHEGIDLMPYGRGGASSDVSVASGNAVGYGASGGTSLNNANGGDGAPGLVIFTEFRRP